jgi:hypothetical protein
MSTNLAQIMKDSEDPGNPMSIMYHLLIIIRQPNVLLSLCITFASLKLLKISMLLKRRNITSEKRKNLAFAGKLNNPYN